MGAAGKNPSAVGEQPAGGNHTVQLLDPAHSSLSELSSELSSPAKTSAAAKAHSEPARSVNSNFLTARAAREGTPPRADAQIEVGLPPRVPPPQGEGGSASGEPANSAGSGTAPGDRQPKRKVIRRIVKVRRVVKKMKKKDEKFLPALMMMMMAIKGAIKLTTTSTTMTNNNDSACKQRQAGAIR
uniref:Uncharacterized protein n=1 Tax=Anopheles atroparvus TaxID=41427 RepID=A0A182JJU1_ANOAO